MSSGPTLPPQAYTREVLTSAFNWLQTQPESVKKLATTPDALVGLFLRAQRFGASSLEADAPVSSQNFISDLKDLAEGLKQFEEPKKRRVPNPTSQPHSSVSASAHALSASIQASLQATQAAAASRANTPSSQMSHSSHHVNHAATMSLDGVSHSQTFSTNAPSPRGPSMLEPEAPAYASLQQTSMSVPASMVLSQHTQAMIHEVKVAMNLSSDAEAINMMIALAYKKLKDLLV